MKCVDAEKLLALYVRSDLTAVGARPVAVHLQTCRRCRQLLEEYRTVQQWTRLYEPPEFGDKFFDSIRHNVLSEIEKEASTPELLQLFIRFARRRTVVTACVALLVVSCATALYIHLDRTADNPAQISANVKNVEGENPNPKLEIPPGSEQSKRISVGSLSPKKNPELLSGHRNRLAFASVPAGNPAPRIRLHQVVERNVKNRPGAELLSNREIIARSAIPPEATLEGDNSSTPARATSQETLKIEMQTSDPNIRIIWFAPKVNGSR